MSAQLRLRRFSQHVLLFLKPRVDTALGFRRQRKFFGRRILEPVSTGCCPNDQCDRQSGSEIDIRHRRQFLDLRVARHGLASRPFFERIFFVRGNLSLINDAILAPKFGLPDVFVLRYPIEPFEIALLKIDPARVVSGFARG
jgi:hypothetical protein